MKKKEEFSSRRPASLYIFKLLGQLQGWVCRGCGQTLESTAQVDHIRPLCHGGTNHPSNLQILCVACHASKTQHEVHRLGLRFSPYFPHHRQSTRYPTPPERALRTAFDPPDADDYTGIVPLRYRIPRPCSSMSPVRRHSTPLSRLRGPPLGSCRLRFRPSTS
jgi:hypothetical protein